MRFVLFYHSLVSDWNHGNAHFLRGVVRELKRLGHEVELLEPDGGWSASNLVRDHGPAALEAYKEAYSDLSSTTYTLDALDLDEVLPGADVVIVHEFNPHELVARIGEHRRRHPSYTLLFHDTHHRGVTAPHEIGGYDLRHYDGVLAFGNVLRDLYLRNGWATRAWTWHEAADVSVFKPLPTHPYSRPEYDLVWIGNWGDEERTAELHQFLLGPVKRLKLKAKVWGVRYPDHAIAALKEHRVAYGGYLPNHRAPEVFANARMTVHVPRRPYTQALPGIPTIRPFEALACGIPLVSSPWQDSEGLFTVGRDFLMAQSGDAMAEALERLRSDASLCSDLAEHGRQTILDRHTCAHRVQQLLGILAETRPTPTAARAGVIAERVVA